MWELSSVNMYEGENVLFYQESFIWSSQIKSIISPEPDVVSFILIFI